MLKRLVNFATLFISFPYLKSMIFLLKSTSTEAVIKTFSRTRKAIITLHISFYAFLKPKIEHFSSCPVCVLTARKACEVSDYFRYRWASRTWLLNFRNTATETFSLYILARAHRLVVLNQFMCTPEAIKGLSNDSWFWTNLCVPQQRLGV